MAAFWEGGYKKASEWHGRRRVKKRLASSVSSLPRSSAVEYSTWFIPRHRTSNRKKMALGMLTNQIQVNWLKSHVFSIWRTVDLAVFLPRRSTTGWSFISTWARTKAGGKWWDEKGIGWWGRDGRISKGSLGSSERGWCGTLNRVSRSVLNQHILDLWMARFCTNPNRSKIFDSVHARILEQ